jgi:hypothetical protein
MKSIISFLLIVSQAISAAAFAVQPQVPAVQLDTPSVAQTKTVNTQMVQQQIIPTSFNSYLESSSNLVSLKDRPPPPTAEEIAAKKANFNLWFWGGGFVAPFLATIYYFGFQFWKR